MDGLPYSVFPCRLHKRRQEGSQGRNNFHKPRHLLGCAGCGRDTRRQ